MKKRAKKRALTLLEIMIVIVLIGIIGTVIGVNMKGSLDQGRAFKTRQAKEQITDILMLEVARGVPIDEVIAKREQYLENSGLVKNGKKFLLDGWNSEFEVTQAGNDKIKVFSARLKAFDDAKKKKIGKSAIPDEEDTQEE